MGVCKAAVLLHGVIEFMSNMVLNLDVLVVFGCLLVSEKDREIW